MANASNSGSMFCMSCISASHLGILSISVLLSGIERTSGDDLVETSPDSLWLSVTQSGPEPLQLCQFVLVHRFDFWVVLPVSRSVKDIQPVVREARGLFRITISRFLNRLSSIDYRNIRLAHIF